MWYRRGASAGLVEALVTAILLLLDTYSSLVVVVVVIAVLLTRYIAPYSFTLGEAITVGVCIARGIHWPDHTSQRVCVLLAASSAVIATAAAAVGRSKEVQVYWRWTLVIALGIYPVFAYTLRMEPITWLVMFIATKSCHLVAVGWWSLLIFLVVWIKPSNKSLGIPNILVRKIYHVMTVVMFSPFIIICPEFVAVAFMGALFIFIWVETIRVIKLKPFANAIDSFMKEYVDSRDQGKLILTHIYLLSGCAFPLWLFFPHEDYTVREIVIWSSGIVSLGIGDTMASFVGKRYGRIKWPKSHKSIEGSSGACIAMGISMEIIRLVSKYLLYPGDYPSSNIWISSFLIAVFEALTDQIDNLYLPIVLSCLLSRI